MSSRTILIWCGLFLAAGGCNQRVPVLDSPVTPTPTATSPDVPSRAPNVASLVISANTVSGGRPLRGTVTLSGPAPAPGVSVSLSANDDVAQVEPAVDIPAGGVSVDFAISTRVVQGDRQVVLTASTPERSVTGSFKVLGEAPPVFFQWFSEPGDFVGAGTSNRLTPGTESFAASCDRNLVFIYLLGPGGENWTLRFSGPAGVPLRRGIYEGATRSPFNTATPGLSVTGRGRGCNTLGGHFQIHDIDVQNNRVNRFHASFVQRCDNSAGLLTGDVRLFDMTAPSVYPNTTCQQ